MNIDSNEIPNIASPPPIETSVNAIEQNALKSEKTRKIGNIALSKYTEIEPGDKQVEIFQNNIRSIYKKDGISENEVTTVMPEQNQDCEINFLDGGRHIAIACQSDSLPAMLEYKNGINTKVVAINETDPNKIKQAFDAINQSEMQNGFELSNAIIGKPTGRSEEIYRSVVDDLTKYIDNSQPSGQNTIVAEYDSYSADQKGGVNFCAQIEDGGHDVRYTINRNPDSEI